MRTREESGDAIEQTLLPVFYPWALWSISQSVSRRTTMIVERPPSVRPEISGKYVDRLFKMKPSLIYQDGFNIESQRFLKGVS